MVEKFGQEHYTKATDYIHTPQNPKSQLDKTIKYIKKNRIIIEECDQIELAKLWNSSKELRELNKLF